jgi:hypothetical protein
MGVWVQLHMGSRGRCSRRSGSALLGLCSNRHRVVTLPGLSTRLSLGESSVSVTDHRVIVEPYKPRGYHERVHRRASHPLSKRR